MSKTPTDTATVSIANRFDATMQRIARAAERSGRDPSEVALIAVTKTVELARIRAAVAAGATRIGENRVQEAASKAANAPDGVEWHLVGHLQSNKARRAVEIFEWIHSVDSVKLLRRLDRMATELGKRPKALVQVNVSGEDAKSGIRPDALGDLMDATTDAMALDICGLMTIGPLTDDESRIRRTFARLRKLSESADWGGATPHLSMGMTADFEIAIEEGATMVRVGTAIFGPRTTG